MARLSLCIKWESTITWKMDIIVSRSRKRLESQFIQAKVWEYPSLAKQTKEVPAGTLSGTEFCEGICRGYRLKQTTQN